jgi:hypothetical protein
MSQHIPIRQIVEIDRTEDPVQSNPIHEASRLSPNQQLKQERRQALESKNPILLKEVLIRVLYDRVKRRIESIDYDRLDDPLLDLNGYHLPLRLERDELFQAWSRSHLLAEGLAPERWKAFCDHHYFRSTVNHLYRQRLQSFYLSHLGNQLVAQSNRQVPTKGRYSTSPLRKANQQLVNRLSNDVEAIARVIKGWVEHLNEIDPQRALTESSKFTRFYSFPREKYHFERYLSQVEYQIGQGVVTFRLSDVTFEPWDIDVNDFVDHRTREAKQHDFGLTDEQVEDLLKPDTPYRESFAAYARGFFLQNVVYVLRDRIRMSCVSPACRYESEPENKAFVEQLKQSTDRAQAVYVEILRGKEAENVDLTGGSYRLRYRKYKKLYFDLKGSLRMT